LPIKHLPGNRENDSSGIIDSYPGCGRLYTVHPIANINNVKDLALILMISVYSLSSLQFCPKTS